jgi:hypothetical protein
MEAVSFSEMSVNIYQTAQCYIPEDIHFHIFVNDDNKSLKLLSNGWPV